MNDKVYNNSRDGNDCYIREYYYWNSDFNLVVCVHSCDGWSESPPMTKVYTSPNSDMPQTVQEWFRNE